MKRKSIILLLVLTLVFTLLAGCAQDAKPTDPVQTGDNKGRVALILGVGGLGDQGFNDLSYAGAQRAKEELDVDFIYAEPAQVSEIEMIMRDMCSSGENQVIIAVGFDSIDAMTKIAQEYPEQQFAIVDATIEQPNVASYVSKEHEGSFLVGMLAGYMAQDDSYGFQKNAVGFIGALETPFFHRFSKAYEAGVYYVNPDATVEIGWVSGNNPFGDTTTAKEIALSQYNKGVGVIYHAAGGSGLGLFQAAKEADLYAIGCNSNQNIIDPEHIAASMLKRADTATFNIIKAAVIDENLPVGEEIELGLAASGIDYTLEGSAVPFSDEVLAKIEEAKAAISSGTLEAPVSQEELDAFKAAH